MNILVGELAFATANLRRARAEAEAANAAKSSFLRAASHELRTPLAVIVWLAEADQGSGARAARSVRAVAGGDPQQRRRVAADDGGGPRTCRAWINPNARTGTWSVIASFPRRSAKPLENLQPLAERKQLGLRLAMDAGRAARS